MPRPVDGFILEEQLENQNSDTEIEDKRLRHVKASKKKRTTDSEATSSKESLSTSQIDILHQSASSETDFSVSPKQNKKKKKSKDDEDGCSSEEERWLHAIESGKLEEVDDELKKIKHKDPKLMTARQRAMMERKSDKDAFGDQLLSLPSGYREKVFTPAMLEEKAKKLQKRKQLADEKREHDKKKTMERLLKKSESKSIKTGQKLRGSKRTVPSVMYINRRDMIAVSMPADLLFPLNQSNSRNQLPKPILCGRVGCTKAKKYSCSTTGIPLCSLKCYKLNLALYSRQCPTVS